MPGPNLKTAREDRQRIVAWRSEGTRYFLCHVPSSIFPPVTCPFDFIYSRSFINSDILKSLVCDVILRLGWVGLVISRPGQDTAH